MEQFLNYALRTGKNVDLSDALSVGGMVTGVGLGIVFSVLVILMLVLVLFRVIFYKDNSKKKTVENNKEQAKPQLVKKDNVDDGELIAVITAAIAASLGTSSEGFRIKSYRRIKNTKPVWNRAGINDSINSRF